MQNWGRGLSLACLCFLIYFSDNYFYCFIKQLKTFWKNKQANKNLVLYN